MSIGIRTILICISFLTMGYMIRKIRQSELEIEYSLFWIAFSLLLIFMSIFPYTVYWLTDIIGLQSPINLVYLGIIFILLIKNFSTTLQISKIENRLKTLVQEIALRDKEEEEKE
ncbi:MAG: DUF2304 domain-containing protein [Lachnospiraceae bacterium]|nr:DUF2304 domain-containing protein [Lachnospiraceae bacterium]